MHSIFKLLPITFAISAGVSSFQPGSCESQKGPSDWFFATEHAQAAPLLKEPLLQGKASQSDLEDYAKVASSAPLLQGTATQAMPAPWKGFWQGGVHLNELEVYPKELRALAAAEVNVQLILEAAQSGTRIFDLSVQAGTEPDPDIHFWHDGNHSHLLLKNGAQMQVGDSVVIGGGAGSDSSMVIIGPGTHVGGYSAGASSGPGASNTQNVNYDDNAITTSGKTTFRGQYFKSDDRINIANAEIQANRIDIGNQTAMTNGAPAVASGTGQSGYLLTRLGGNFQVKVVPTAKLPASLVNTAQAAPINLIGPHEDLLKIRTVKVAQGTYDVETVTKINGQSGGTRQIVSRYTALDQNRMIVQMTIRNFDSNGALADAFNISGYLYRQ